MKKTVSLILAAILCTSLLLSGCSSSSVKREPLPDESISSNDDLDALLSNNDQDTEPIDPEFQLATEHMEQDMQAYVDAMEGRGGTWSFSTSATTWTVVLRMPMPTDDYKAEYLKGNEDLELALFEMFLTVASMAADAYVDMENAGFADKFVHFEFRAIEDDTLFCSSTIGANSVSNFNIVDDVWDASEESSKMLDKQDNDKSAFNKGDNIPLPKIDSSSKATTGQRNALKTAKSYLSVMGFSYNGLIGQLEYEQYSHEDAVYAADNCGADWNEQAAKVARSYLDAMSFSKNGLIDQLEYEGFTHEQAVYGAEANGY